MSSEVTEQEVIQYDRQIRLWGLGKGSKNYAFFTEYFFSTKNSKLYRRRFLKNSPNFPTKFYPLNDSYKLLASYHVKA